MNTEPGNNSTGNLPSELSNKLEQDFLCLPGPLSKNYSVLSCLKYSEQTATYLLCQKASGRTVLLKTASDPLFKKSLYNEKQILDTIHHSKKPDAAAFPVPLELYELEHVTCFIRSYIQGKTLEDLCESSLKKPGLSEEQTLLYMIHLTKQLHFLHTLEPPIIHRDIKPQNAVVDTEDTCHFIDLGISCFFEKNQKNDAPIMGTHATAPPEQFGYQQTDARSDLYSLGILLYYCLTGEYKISKENLAELSPAIRKIVRKATMFDPDKRYQSASELMADLMAAPFQTPSIASAPEMGKDPARPFSDFSV